MRFIAAVMVCWLASVISVAAHPSLVPHEHPHSSAWGTGLEPFVLIALAGPVVVALILAVNKRSKAEPARHRRGQK